MTTCQWFAGCTNEAVGVVRHPVLGDVPTCQRCATKLDLDLVLDTFEADLDAAVNAWPNIERNVPVTPALRRRFVSRNFCWAYNFHVVYDLSGTLYAVTGSQGNEVITARCEATNQNATDLLALLSEWER